MKITPVETTVDLKDILFDLLAKEKVKKFSVTFDGSGDSGQIEDIDLEDNILQKKLRELGFRTVGSIRQKARLAFTMMPRRFVILSMAFVMMCWSRCVAVGRSTVVVMVHSFLM